MHIELSTGVADTYFARQGVEIDYSDGPTKEGMISEDQAENISSILALEYAVHVLRRCTGGCGSQWENLVRQRRKLIEEYELCYADYVEYNDFY